MNLNREESKFSFSVDSHKIRNFKDFKRLLEEGTVVCFSFGTVRFLKNDKATLRVAISVSKKFSKKSSVRNRVKRKLIEFFRLSQHKLRGIDIWVYVRIWKDENEILKEIEEFTKNLML
ncbi:MAG: ribonuclease P protein component [Brevinematia bacterium]